MTCALKNSPVPEGLAKQAGFFLQERYCTCFCVALGLAAFLEVSAMLAALSAGVSPPVSGQLLFMGYY